MPLQGAEAWRLSVIFADASDDVVKHQTLITTSQLQPCLCNAEDVKSASNITMRILRICLLLVTYLHDSIAVDLQKPLLDPANELSSASKWGFNFSSEAPHYFASAYGLLQQWSNTFFPSGHSIVPCEIPLFTKLYHGRMDNEYPPSPEWVAFDMQVPLHIHIAIY